jgi:hypothetical protein
MKVTLPVAFACGALLAGEAQAASPLDDLIPPKTGASACFVRAYDEAHLRAHPKQRVTFIAAWMQYTELPEVSGPILNLSFAIRRRGERDALFSQGGCIWNEMANRDTSDRRLIPAFKKDEAVICNQSARPDVFDVVSAEEGGDLIIDRGTDKDTLMMYLEDGLLMVKRARRDDILDIDFGPDDRVFMLRRADPKACAFIEEAVTTPERGAPDGQR